MFINKTLINVRSYTTFQRLGISDAITNQLKTNFGIKQATQAQSEFIPAILSGKDLFLRDATGTGKTFGITLTLASQPTCRSLYITPNQELAAQINQWVQRLHQASSDHVIVDTPARLMQRIKDPAQHHQFQNINRIILDEADQALRLPKRYATLRQQQQRQQHPKPAQIVMTSLFNDPVYTKKKPQLIVSSATLNRTLRHWMTQQGWMQNPLFIDITKGNQIPHHHNTTTTIAAAAATTTLGSSVTAPVQHHCLMVSDDAIRNIAPSSFTTTSDNVKYSSLMESTITPPKTTSFKDDDDRMLESIAILHELEASELQNSVLFVDTSVSTAGIQTKLASHNIHSRDIRDAISTTTAESSSSAHNNNNNNKTLWIATEFTARGIDLPHISHVFILGMPSSITSYIHMAGRTGRLGIDGNMGRGKVISLVRDHGKSEAKMVNMYNLMNVPVRLLEHVE